MKFKHSILGLGVGIAASGLCVAASPAQAMTFGPVTIEGTQYDISTREGSYGAAPTGLNSANSPIEGNLASLLQSQPWWGKSAIAQDLAGQVGTSLGLGNIPSAGSEQEGPYFAFEVINGVVSAWNWDGNNHPPGVEVDTVHNGVNNNLIWAIATPTPVTPPTTPIPTPALLPALLGFGLKVSRRQKNQTAASAEA